MINYKKIIIELKKIVLRNSYIKEKFINLNVFKIVYLKYLMDNDYINISKDKLIDLFKSFSISDMLEYSSHEENSEIDDYPISISYSDSKLLSELLTQKCWFESESVEKLSYIYVNLYSNQERINKDIVFVPSYIADATCQLVNIQLNENSKVLDPACGGGCFLIKMYDMLYKNLSTDMTSYERHKYILDHCLYACDYDDIAVTCTKLIMSLKNKKIYFSKNILYGDILLDSLYQNHTFDVIMGFLPNNRQKRYDREQTDLIFERFGDILESRSNLSDCFFSLAKQRLQSAGFMCYITDRKVLESKYSTKLRKFIIDNYSIKHIIDFFGIKIINNTNMRPAIICAKNTPFDENNTILIRRAETNKCKEVSVADLFNVLDSENEKCYFERIYVKNKQLNPKMFLFIDNKNKQIKEKIESKSLIQLKDILNVHQGIITGYDKAFIFPKDEVNLNNFDKHLIKPWIKSSDICSYYIKSNSTVLLYSNDLELTKNINEIRHLKQYRSKLSQRRECINGKLPWYFLQWGRNKEIFQMPKIVYPCKSDKNRFAFDTKGNYFSADIYALTLKSYAYNISYEYLCILLNSELYDFYFKTFAKKISEKRYEYYSDNLLKLKIPVLNINNENIKKAYKQLTNSVNTNDFLNNMNEINNFVYKIFDLTDDEIYYIKNKGAQTCTM